MSIVVIIDRHVNSRSEKWWDEQASFLRAAYCKEGTMLKPRENNPITLLEKVQSPESSGATVAVGTNRQVLNMRSASGAFLVGGWSLKVGAFRRRQVRPVCSVCTITIIDESSDEVIRSWEGHIFFVFPIAVIEKEIRGPMDLFHFFNDSRSMAYWVFFVLMVAYAWTGD